MDLIALDFQMFGMDKMNAGNNKRWETIISILKTNVPEERRGEGRWGEGEAKKEKKGVVSRRRASCPNSEQLVNTAQGASGKTIAKIGFSVEKFWSVVWKFFPRPARASSKG